MSNSNSALPSAEPSSSTQPSLPLPAIHDVPPAPGGPSASHVAAAEVGAQLISRLDINDTRGNVGDGLGGAQSPGIGPSSGSPPRPPLSTCGESAPSPEPPHVALYDGHEVSIDGEVIGGVFYRRYRSEKLDTGDVVRLVEAELSEPYNIYTFRFFLHEWPNLTYLAYSSPDDSRAIGAIVCKQDAPWGRRNRGYIAMLSVEPGHRRRGIASTLVRISLSEMARQGGYEAVIETEYDNASALALYRSIGFVEDKRIPGFYMSGKDAIRLILPLTGYRGGIQRPLYNEARQERDTITHDYESADDGYDDGETRSEASYGRWEAAAGPEWLEQLDEDEALLRGLGGEMGDPLPAPPGAEEALKELYRRRAAEQAARGQAESDEKARGWDREEWDRSGERPGTPQVRDGDGKPDLPPRPPVPEGLYI